MASSPFDLKDDEFETRVLESPRPVVVHFWAQWCGPCRQVAPLTVKISEELRDRVDWLKVNTDENPRIPQELDIPSIPAFVLMDGGVEQSRWVGRKQFEQLRSDLIGLLDARGSHHEKG